MDTAPPPLPPPQPWKARPLPPKSAARRITRGVCWVVSLFWLAAWPLAVWVFDVQFSGYHQAPRIWAVMLYPIAMLWLAYWLVAWFFWVSWPEVWPALFEPARTAQTPPEGDSAAATEPARS